MICLLLFFISCHAWEQWQPVAQPRYDSSLSATPHARERAAMWCVPEGFYLMGSLGDMWKYEYNPKRWWWMPNSTVYAYHSAYWNIDDTLYLFGGLNTTSSQLFKFSQTTRQWEAEDTSDDVPPWRFDAVFWTDGVRNLYLYGGTNNGTDLNDFWEYNTEARTWRSLPAFGPATNAPGVAGYIYVSPKIWHWDGTQWDALEGPVHSFQQGRMWALSKDMFLFYLDDTSWVMEDNAWMRLNTSPTHRLNYSHCSSDAVIFGGAGRFNDVWRYGARPTNGQIFGMSPELAVSISNLILILVALVILITFAIVLIVQEIRRRRNRLGPFVVQQNDNTDFL